MSHPGAVARSGLCQSRRRWLSPPSRIPMRSSPCPSTPKQVSAASRMPLVTLTPGRRSGTTGLATTKHRPDPLRLICSALKRISVHKPISSSLSPTLTSPMTTLVTFPTNRPQVLGMLPAKTSVRQVMYIEACRGLATVPATSGGLGDGNLAARLPLGTAKVDLVLPATVTPSVGLETAIKRAQDDGENDQTPEGEGNARRHVPFIGQRGRPLELGPSELRRKRIVLLPQCVTRGG